MQNNQMQNDTAETATETLENNYEYYILGGGIASLEDWQRFVVKGDLVTEKELKAIVQEKQIRFAPARRCSICNEAIGWHFAPAGEVFTHPPAPGVESTDLIAGFNSSCGCTSYDAGIELRSWDSLADTFNLQTYIDRADIWTRFKNGGVMLENG